MSRQLAQCGVNLLMTDAATRALETLNHTEICGRSVRLMPSQRDPSARRSGVGNVFAKVSCWLHRRRELLTAHNPDWSARVPCRTSTQIG